MLTQSKSLANDGIAQSNCPWKVEELKLNLRKRWKITQRKSLATAGIAQWECWEVDRQSKSNSKGYEFMGRDTQVIYKCIERKL